MKFFYYGSLLFLGLAVGLGLLAIGDGSTAILILYVQFGLGCWHLLSTIFALAKYGTQKPWYVVHLGICLAYIGLLFLGSLDINFGMEFLVVGIIVIPWIIAIVHSNQLYRCISQARVHILDI